MMDQLLTTLPELLTHSLSSDVSIRKAAEEQILNLEKTSPYYGYATLSLTQNQQLTHEIKTLAAIAFKNFVKRHWRFDPNDQVVDVIDSQQREKIKRDLTKMMLQSSSHIQRQLSESITIIAQTDFPDHWNWLIVELRDSLSDKQNANFGTISGVLETAHSVFRRYRHELPSNKLWTEIKYVVENFAEPFTNRFRDLVEAARNGNPQDMVHIVDSLLLCTKIFRSLITQDLPDFFEERLGELLPMLIYLLEFQIKLDDDSSKLDDIKSEVCEIASLFVHRYSDAEHAREYIQSFAGQICTLLVTTGQDVRHDTLVSAAIRYLVTVASSPDSRSLFKNQETLNTLCERVIIPNLIFRDEDETLFEDDPEEYVKRDIEGSDLDTRRRAASDLVQALSKFIEAQMIELFGRFIVDMLKTDNWRHKDLAIYLYTAMSIKGSTRQHGIVSISTFVDVNKFFEENIASELNSNENHIGAYVLTADALRYLTNFRNQLSLNNIVAHLPNVIRHLTSRNVVVKTYAAITLERLLTLRDPQQPNQTALRSEQFEPHLSTLVGFLFDALDSTVNEYIMKAIMRLFSFSRSHSLVQFLPTVVPKITQKLDSVAKNPCKPYFNHYLFETLALLIRAACEHNDQTIIQGFETVLFDIYDYVVTKDVQEFIPYVLQLLNPILRAQQPGKVSQKFKEFLQQLITPVLCETENKSYQLLSANVRPLSELLRSYIMLMPQDIGIENLLKIFRYLFASKATDHEGLELLQTMIIYIPANDFDPMVREFFKLMFQRLTGSKTIKLVKGVLVCFALYAHLRGADQLALAVNQLQNGIFGMVVEKLFIADVKKVTGFVERRICICGVIKILTQLPLIDNGAYNQLWGPLLLVLMEMFELPLEVGSDEDDHFADITESLDFQAQYSRLNYATIKRDDPTKESGDLKKTLATSLANLSIKLPGFVPQTVATLDPGVSTCLSNYCQAANVVIN